MPSSYVGQITVTNISDSPLEDWEVFWQYLVGVDIYAAINGAIQGGIPYSISGRQMFPGESTTVRFWTRDRSRTL